MLKRITSLFFALAGFCLVATAASAGDEWRYVSADARWAVVVRVSELLESQTGEAFMETHRDERTRHWRESVQRDFGIDPETEVSTVILFGTDGDRENGVVIVLGEFEREHPTDALTAKEGYERFVRDGNEIHVWDTGAASYPEAGIAVLGRRLEPVARALDTMEGRISRLAPETLFGPQGYLEEGGFLAGFSSEFPAVHEMPPQAAILRHARGLRVILGESGDYFWGSLHLEIPDEDAAVQIENILRGFSGFARLGEEMRDPFSIFLRHASVERDAGEVRVEFDVPFSDLTFRRPPNRRMGYEFRRGE